jgi:hypothetical protein
MLLIIDLLLLIFLGWIAFQDFRERQISWLLLPPVFIFFAWKGFLTQSPAALITGFVLNSCFILVQLLLLTLWMSLRNKKWTTIIDVHLGLGDILFFAAITAAFEPFLFVVFYVLSMIITLAGVLISRLLLPRANPEIPLAGSMAMVLMICIIITAMVPSIDFYTRPVLFSFL